MKSIRLLKITVACVAFILMAAPGIISTGCVTKAENAANVPIEQTRAYTITTELVYLGSVAALKTKPEYKPALEKASVALQALVDSSRWDLAAAAGALSAAGLTQGQTPDAMMLIAGAGEIQVLFDAITGKPLDLRRNRNAEAWIRGANAGLGRALGKPVAGLPVTAAVRAIPGEVDPTTAAMLRNAAVASRGRP